MRLIRGTSIDRFEKLKAAIRDRRPGQYPGENIEAMATHYKRDAQELIKGSQYDHNLTRTMIDGFIAAGGIGNEGFRFPLRVLKIQLETELLTIAYKDKEEARLHMEEKSLTFRDVCDLAEKSYYAQKNENKWPPSSAVRDGRALPAAVTNPQGNTLIQQSAPPKFEGGNGKDKTKGGVCHNCGKPGHWRNECPAPKKPPKERQDRNGGSTRKKREGQDRFWRKVKPAPGEPHTKNRNDRDFHWCEKCKRWTTSHGSEGHLGSRAVRTSAATSANVAEFPLFENASCWVAEANSAPWTAPNFYLVSLLFSLLPFFGSTAFSWLSLFGSAAEWFFSWMALHPLECIAPTFWLIAALGSFVIPHLPRAPPAPDPDPPERLNRHHRRAMAKCISRSFHKSCLQSQQLPGRFRDDRLHHRYPLNKRAVGL